SALGDSGVTVTQVSVSAISSSEVLFDAIVLELAGGGTLFIEGIALPVRFRGLRDSRLDIDTVRFVPGNQDTGPPGLAAGLQGFLDAPAATPGATVEIARVLLPGMPPVLNVAWHADVLNPTLRAAIGDFAVFLTTTKLADGAYKGSIRALLPDDTEALMAGFQLAPENPGFRIDGTFSVLLEPLSPALLAVGAIPAEVVALSAALDGTFGFTLDADETRPVEIQAVVETLSGAVVSYRAGDATLEVSITQSTPVNATLAYPSLDWTGQVARSSLSVRGAGVDLPPVRLHDSECRSGIRCRTALDLSWDDLAMGELTIDRVSASAAAVEFVSQDEQWKVTAPDTRLSLNSPAFGGRGVLSPAVRGDIVGSNEKVSASFRFSMPEGGLSGSGQVSHHLLQDRGNLSVQSAAIEFDTLSLSGIFADWAYDWDIEAGRATAAADIHWQASDAGFTYEGTATLTADSLAGRYADIGFVGMSGKLDAALNSNTGVSFEPVRFDVALVDIGFPVENISGTAMPYLDESAVAVSTLSMNLLGGTVTAEPFRYELDAGSNRLILEASGIQLPLMAALADLEAVKISGSVSGKIPVTIRGDNVIIDGGRLENDPPGGVIRYGGGAADGVVDDRSQLGVVTRTLRNFEFDSLTSAVEYSRDGDLVLQMRLKGVTPDVDPTQPVILNLTVENNVPQRLRSLQATRSIEDVL
ncbi:MAG TPA: YdbH domain-containing protein, partial [Woeseiaceae bacterium]|nr:YdbH domain-containing protein [Woeseiaceae bacterium]